MRAEPEYQVVWQSNSVTVWVEKIDNPDQSIVPFDGSIMLRDPVTEEIVGKRIDDVNIKKWTYITMADTFARAFGWGSAGPIIAVSLSCPTDLMRKKYEAQYNRSMPDRVR